MRSVAKEAHFDCQRIFRGLDASTIIIIYLHLDFELCVEFSRSLESLKVIVWTRRVQSKHCNQSIDGNTILPRAIKIRTYRHLGRCGALPLSLRDKASRFLGGEALRVSTS